MNRLRHLYYTAILFLLTGCLSGGVKLNDEGEVVKKADRLFGLIPMPGTGAGDLAVPPTAKEQAMDQLAPLIWASIPLIIGGAVFWWITKGGTGFGKLFMGLGLLFIVIPVIIPTIIVYLKWAVLIALAGLAVYGVFYLVRYLKERRAAKAAK